MQRTTKKDRDEFIQKLPTVGSDVVGSSEANLPPAVRHRSSAIVTLRRIRCSVRVPQLGY